ncbi:hypothetical protein Ancab_026096 [Ancistrocladus abbreviatus]
MQDLWMEASISVGEFCVLFSWMQGKVLISSFSVVSASFQNKPREVEELSHPINNCKTLPVEENIPKENGPEIWSAVKQPDQQKKGSKRSSGESPFLLNFIGNYGPSSVVRPKGESSLGRKQNA